MIFDTHTDILYDIVRRRLRKETQSLQDYHIPQMLEGSVTGGIWTYYTDINHKQFEHIDDALVHVFEELSQTDNIHLVMHHDDWVDHKMNVLLGLEGLASIRDLNHMKLLYEQGFRHAMLTWNEQNHYATGVAGDSERGLTELGVKMVKLMNELGMVIDVSHANEKTFYDILAVAKGPILASHSNCYALQPHRRNLKDEQIKAIAKTDGVIGVTAVPSFTADKEATIQDLVNHIDHIKKLVGIQHIALGFDFMNYLSDDKKNANLIDCPSASSAHHVIDELMERGYSSYEIDRIVNLNAKRVINQILK